MKLQFKPSDPMPVGSYLAKVAIVEPTTGQYGDQLKFSFDILKPDAQAGRQLTAWTSARLSPQSKLYKWLTALYGDVAAVPLDENMEWDSDDAVGRQVVVDVVVETRADGSEFNKVNALRPVRAQRPAATVPQAPKAAAPKAVAPPPVASVDDDERWSQIVADEGAATGAVEPW